MILFSFFNFLSARYLQVVYNILTPFLYCVNPKHINTPTKKEYLASCTIETQPGVIYFFNPLVGLHYILLMIYILGNTRTRPKIFLSVTLRA